MCLIFAKSGVELLLISIHGNNQFWKWQPWMLVFGLVVFALLQLWYLNRALKLANPTFVCPCEHPLSPFSRHPITKPRVLVAFCFYNLSSIVNSLVYFDQISLLPTSHLLLVTVGIFILLGGVWAVSLQAVTVDTWTGDDVDVPLVEDGIADEESIPECQPSPAPPAPPSPERERALSHSESATSPPQSPLSPRRRATQRHLRHGSIGATISHSSPPSSVPAPIFSIGLSPASPGFVLVPLERRRSISGQLGGDPWVEVIRRVRARRVVSDTDILAGEEVERGIEEAGTVGNERVDAHGRWAWLRSLVVGQRDVS